MKTIVEVNSTNYSSTGSITLGIATKAREYGYTVYTCCKNSKESKKYHYDNQIIIGFRVERIISDFLSYLTGLRDSFNIFGTLLFIRKLKKIKPDIVHLHTIHDNFINISILFKYLSKSNTHVVWTMHDCWAVTGQCPIFDRIGCDKWKTLCNNCPQVHSTPKSFIFDTSSFLYKKKKCLFNSINNMIITTPSNWMESIIKHSYLNKYKILTINNGIDLSIFKERESKLKESYKINDKYIVLGVANEWVERKGIDDFIKLSFDLPSNYQIVLIGKCEKNLPSNIIHISRTFDKQQLSKWYSIADVFVNPTMEEVFGLVNVESLACGTPVISYNTGGCVEIIDDTCGKIIEKGNVDSLYKAIIYTCENKPYNVDDCIARSKLFDCKDKFSEYVNLYEKITNPSI